MRHSDYERDDDEGEALLGRPGSLPEKAQRPCLICRRELGPDERKVHKGACQRARRTQLQRLQRGRARRW